jgi:hypothetical protein
VRNFEQYKIRTSTYLSFVSYKAYGAAGFLASASSTCFASASAYLVSTGPVVSFTGVVVLRSTHLIYKKGTMINKASSLSKRKHTVMYSPDSLSCRTETEPDIAVGRPGENFPFIRCRKQRRLCETQNVHGPSKILRFRDVYKSMRGER